MLFLVIFRPGVASYIRTNERVSPDLLNQRFKYWIIHFNDRELARTWAALIASEVCWGFFHTRPTFGVSSHSPAWPMSGPQEYLTLRHLWTILGANASWLPSRRQVPAGSDNKEWITCFLRAYAGSFVSL